MYIVLLSGGSGKRLWPLSNDLCSKQYIKLMNHDGKEDQGEMFHAPECIRTVRDCRSFREHDCLCQAAHRWN